MSDMRGGLRMKIRIAFIMVLNSLVMFTWGMMGGVMSAKNSLNKCSIPAITEVSLRQ